MLKNKKIVVAICGSIAAYKSATLVRLLLKSGAEVRVIMTPSACDFITPLTLSTLSNYPVYTDFFIDEHKTAWNNHVELGLWADLMIVAPASASTIGKAVSGISDNFLLAVYLSAKCPVWWAPAMDLDMWKHESTQQNIQTLIQRGNKVLEPGTGLLASGLEGKGRMMEPEDIALQVEQHLGTIARFQNKKILITAGPTYEAIDPVRFIGNRSTGKMGYAIAEALYEQGAEVTVISGPTALSLSKGIHVVHVESAQQMLLAVQEQFQNQDAAIFSAAVADYTPELVADQKIKKQEQAFSLQLQKTTDIAAWCGEAKKRQFLVGFALETENEREYALSKMKRKNQDMIVLNSLNDKGAGFASDTNKITVFSQRDQQYTFELKSKVEVANDIIDIIYQEWIYENKA
jgi:phosphopantothenoylcysteine decarboxylase/phosphopantothenate--cysteine ligase